MNQKVVVYNENYITNLLATKAEENTYLEFKRADSLIIHPDNKSKNLEEIKNEIAKDVSAFANSDGGVLIYGIAEENHVATDYSFIDGNIFTKETLEQIINSRIHRKIEGFHIEPIRFNNDIEKTIYVIEIPRSINVPHQTKDKNFYIRRNFKIEKLEEFEIRDLYNRKNQSKLEILNPTITTPVNNIFKSNKGVEFYLEIKVAFFIKNIGNSIEENYKTEIKIPKGITLQDFYTTTQISKSFFDRRSFHSDDYTIFSFPCLNPIFQGETLFIDSVSLKITQNMLKTLKVLPFKIKLYHSHGVIEKDVFLFDEIENLNSNEIVQELLSY